MNYIYKILLSISIVFSSMYLHTWQASPEDSFFAVDIDEVLVEPSLFQKPNLIFGGIWQHPFNSHNWILSLLNIKSNYKKDAQGKREKLSDENGNSINGLSFHFLYHAMKDFHLAQYMPWIVDIIEYSRTPIQGTVEICKYLKEKGYSIVFATNKDRPSYDCFAKYIGDEVTNLAQQIFVAHPGNNEAFLNKIKKYAQQPNVPACYKKFVYKALTVQPTEHIKHVPALKPDVKYYEYVHQTVKKELNKKHMFFVDDKDINIEGVQQYQDQLTPDEHVVGIPFKNPYLLAQQLVKLGVLSEIHDKEFLNKMKWYK